MRRNKHSRYGTFLRFYRTFCFVAIIKDGRNFLLNKVSLDPELFDPYYVPPSEILVNCFPSWIIRLLQRISFSQTNKWPLRKQIRLI